MDEEDISTDQPKPRWYIDFNWFQQNNRSLSALIQDYPCAKRSEQLNDRKRGLSEAKFLSIIKECCADDPQFITDRLPILESVFRFFLANGNQPLDLKELSQQLSERRGGDTYHTSPEILSRLLKRDRYYGLREVTG